MSNRSIGNKFEDDFCRLLASEGFWVHNMAQNKAGQPADVIACKNKTPFLIDCKVCEKDEFPLSRIENNQDTAMSLWNFRGNGTGWFALKMSYGVIYMMSHEKLIELKATNKKLNLKEIQTYGYAFYDWLFMENMLN